ncbi:hypothetical protein JOD57_001661 [Geodermatophilus bullaregiensis]|uniref:aldo/keto reductase n=1 Tax=Geodermatophilus bullaregiensis TaxID=1564160 RepID=UPI001EF895CA|nr:aldo/keto reductase [Geodermatophilus bullaregiensis]MBM7805824.1 hypothetical protein [Geodermatophilus bullaregiensis]
MVFGPWGNDDRADSIRIIHRALDAGTNVVDTADVYSGGVSEEIVGEALQGRRDDVVLGTKFFVPMGEDPNHRSGSRRWIIRVENSLRRLGTDHIDLSQVHRPSPDTDVEETLGALTDLVRAGKVRYIGRPRTPARRSWRPSGPPASGTRSGSSPSSLRTAAAPSTVGRVPAARSSPASRPCTTRSTSASSRNRWLRALSGSPPVTTAQPGTRPITRNSTGPAVVSTAS